MEAQDWARPHVRVAANTYQACFLLAHRSTRIYDCSPLLFRTDGCRHDSRLQLRISDETGSHGEGKFLHDRFLLHACEFVAMEAIVPRIA